MEQNSKNREIFPRDQEFSRFFLKFRSRTANSFVSTSYFHIFGKKIAKIATTATHKRPPEVTEKESEVAAAIEAAATAVEVEPDFEAVEEVRKGA